MFTTGPACLKGPLPRRSHANAVIGLEVSVELDTSATVWPTVGDAGNHLNEATGGPGVPCAGLLTLNVTGPLTPTFPAQSLSLACTVYVPGPRPAKTTDQQQIVGGVVVHVLDEVVRQADAEL